jgi:uncharacterized damage-inducible protein DinB
LDPPSVIVILRFLLFIQRINVLKNTSVTELREKQKIGMGLFLILQTILHIYMYIYIYIHVYIYTCIYEKLWWKLAKKSPSAIYKIEGPGS